MNGTLQSLSNGVFCMTIFTNMSVPIEVTQQGEDAIRAHVEARLTAACAAVPELNFEVEIGPSTRRDTVVEFLAEEGYE